MDSGEANDPAGRLVRACLDGDEEGQRELVRRYAGLCCTIASRILGRDGQAYVEDAVQEALYAVFAKLAQWRGENLSAWIGTIAARRAIDMRRKLQRRRAETAGLDADQFAGPVQHDERAESADLREAIDAARSRLTDRQQLLLDALLAGRSRSQMAEALGISVRTVHYELNELRRLLADSLKSAWFRCG